MLSPWPPSELVKQADLSVHLGVRQVRSVKADLEACKQHMVKEREEHEQTLRRTEEEWATKTTSLQEEAKASAEATQKDHEAQVAILAQVPNSRLRAKWCYDS